MAVRVQCTYSHWPFTYVFHADVAVDGLQLHVTCSYMQQGRVALSYTALAAALYALLPHRHPLCYAAWFVASCLLQQSQHPIINSAATVNTVLRLQHNPDFLAPVLLPAAMRFVW